MAKSRGREAWNHTSAILALISNINRAKGKSPVKPESLNPYARRGRGSDQVMVINRQEAQNIFRQIAEKSKNN